MTTRLQLLAAIGSIAFLAGCAGQNSAIGSADVGAEEEFTGELGVTDDADDV